MATHKRGDVRHDGFIFNSYAKAKSGNTVEWWLSPDALHRQSINAAVNTAKARSKKKVVPFDIDVEYLVSIYPADKKCPALGIDLIWGRTSPRNNSPSLDRIVPERGYVKGNVRWLSMLANQIKTNATTAEVCAVADYLRKID